MDIIGLFVLWNRVALILAGDTTRLERRARPRRLRLRAAKRRRGILVHALKTSWLDVVDQIVVVLLFDQQTDESDDRGAQGVDSCAQCVDRGDRGNVWRNYGGGRTLT
jgi:hypothetical protein